MAVSRKRSAPERQSPSDILQIFEDLENIYMELLQAAQQPRISETLRKWVGKLERIEDDADTLAIAQALVLASDLDIFTPSMTGSTSLDRFTRRRKMTKSETTALTVMQRARFTPFRITSIGGDGTFSVENLVTRQSMTVSGKELPDSAVGLAMVGRLCALPNATFVIIGPMTPIDEAGLAVAMEFVKSGQGISNDYRCAAAVFRHVVRHGNPQVPGVNAPPEGEDWGEIDDDDNEALIPPGMNALDLIAMLWAHHEREGNAPEPESFDDIRNHASPLNVLEACLKAVIAPKRDLPEIGQAYRREATVMMETLQRRAQAGSGHDANPLDTIARLLDHEIANNDYPPEAAALFHELRKSMAAQAKPKQTGDELTRVIERIRALRAKTIDQGCTESEAMAAAKKVAELLDRYGLSVSEIDIKGQTCEGVGIDSNRKRATPLDDCLPAIAHFCDCRAWTEKTVTGMVRSVFFGLPADVEAAHYLYERVATAFETETKAFQKGALYVKAAGSQRRTATNSFQIGLARGINAKLGGMKAERDESFRTQSGRDLVLVKNDVIEDDLAKLGMTFAREQRRSRRVQREAYNAGEVAGRKFEARGALRS